MNDPFSRVCMLYFKDYVIRFKKPTVFPDLQLSGHERFNHRDYIVLRDTAGKAMRVYRIRTDGSLRRLIPWPAALNSPPPAQPRIHELHTRVEK